MSNGTGNKEHILQVARAVENFLLPLCDKVEVVGSIRRNKEEPHDVDIVLIPKDKEQIRSLMSIRGNREMGGSKKEAWIIEGIKVELYYATEETWGAFVLMYTGSKEYNIMMRVKAKGMGLMLNQYGLFKGKELIVSRTEESIFRALGMPYVEPEKR